MDGKSNKPIPYIDLSTDNFLNEFTQDIPNTNAPAKEQSQQNITATDDNDNRNNLQTEPKQVDDSNSLPRNGERLRCPECFRYTARDEDQLTRHIRKVHRGENPFQCFMCDYGTYNKSLFEEHVRIHKGIKPFKCSHCPHRSASKKNLKRHEFIHRPDNPLKCPHCDHIANHQAGYNSHAKKYHPLKCDGDLTCSWCQKNFPDQNSLVMHAARIKTCNTLLDGGSNSWCQKNFPDQNSLVMHAGRIKTCNTLLDGGSNRKCDRDLTCSWCQKNFPDQNSLVMHTARIKSCNALLEDGQNRCDYRTCSIYKMKSHRVSEHGEPPNPPAKRKVWKCQLCGWASNTKSMVLLHLIHHPNQTVDESQVDLSILRKHGIVP